jgi:hypothetical protein
LPASDHLPVAYTESVYGVFAETRTGAGAAMGCGVVDARHTDGGSFACARADCAHAGAEDGCGCGGPGRVTMF